MARKRAEPKLEYPVSIETFRDMAGYQMQSMTEAEPSCFNGIVRVVKYRVTVERIEEPDEVIRARIQALWDKSTNHHDRWTLRYVGEKYGLDLK